MSESEKPFTVSDRRHFTPDGRPRDVVEPEPGPRSVPSSVPGEDVPPAREEAPRSTRAEPKAAGSPTGEGEADFTQFLLSLGAQAGMFLSPEARPEEMDPAEALGGARSIISILEMLRTKTEGRRTSDEDSVLEGLLYELRMAYVEASRASGS